MKTTDKKKVFEELISNYDLLLKESENLVIELDNLLNSNNELKQKSKKIINYIESVLNFEANQTKV